jgi:hypothetical protein
MRDLIVGEVDRLTLERFQEALLEELLGRIRAIDRSIDNYLVGLFKC